MTSQYDLFGKHKVVKADSSTDNSIYPYENITGLCLVAASCRACPLHSQGRSQVVVFRGNPESSVMAVGEAPGAEEDAKGEPWCGPAGQLFDNLFADFGIDTNDFYVTNIVKCRPPSNRTPSKAEIDTCTSRWLLNEIELVRPKLVIALGAPASRHFHPTPTKKMEQIAGTFVSNLGTTHKFHALFLYHPAAILHERRFNKSTKFVETRRALGIYSEMIKSTLKKG